MKDDGNHIPYEVFERYWSNKIEADEKASVERHIADCIFCRQDLEDMKQYRPIEDQPKSLWRKLTGR